MLVGYSLLACVQYAASFFVSPPSIFFALYLLPLNKLNFLFGALNVQIFEWLNCWFAMSFQKDYDITTVGIEKRKFQPRERFYWNLLLAVLWFICVISNSIMVCSPLIKETSELLQYNILRVTLIVYLSFTWILLLAVLILFP